MKGHRQGQRASPDWEDSFVDNFSNVYRHSSSSLRLIELHPNTQIIGANLSLEWQPVNTNSCKNDLHITVKMLKAIRNNLFHGGKHGLPQSDNLHRNLELLNTGLNVLHELADMSNFTDDYQGNY